MMTEGLDMLDTFSKQTLEQVSSAVCSNEDGPSSADAFTDYSSSTSNRTLSSILRQAKTLAESRSQENQQLKEAQQANFSWLFDNYKGLHTIIEYSFSIVI